MFKRRLLYVITLATLTACGCGCLPKLPLCNECLTGLVSTLGNLFILSQAV